MNRRSFLVAAGIIAASGCVGSSGSSDPQATAVGEKPEIVDVALVSDWQDFGDIRENRISRVTLGDPAIVAYRFIMQIHDGTVHPFEQTTIYDGEEGNQLDIQQHDEQQLIDAKEATPLEHAMLFDLSRWGAGEYIAEVIVRDEIDGDVSEPFNLRFEVRIE